MTDFQIRVQPVSPVISGQASIYLVEKHQTGLTNIQVTRCSQLHHLWSFSECQMPWRRPKLWPDPPQPKDTIKGNQTHNNLTFWWLLTVVIQRIKSDHSLEWPTALLLSRRRVCFNDVDLDLTLSELNLCIGQATTKTKSHTHQILMCMIFIQILKFWIES